MRISDWSSDVCSSDLWRGRGRCWSRSGPGIWWVRTACRRCWRPRGSTCGGCSKAGERHRGRCRRSRRTTLAACISAVFPLCARASVMVIPGGVAECATVSRRNDMSDQLMLTAETRESGGQEASRELRRKGRFPAVVYGGNEDPLMHHVEEKLLLKTLINGVFLTSGL